MPPRGEIKSEKILVKDIFSRLWFRIPEYQRPYVWGPDEVNDLLDDLTFAMEEKADFEYFLGSFVFQSRPVSSDGQTFIENDLLDGQQRLATLLMLFGVLRDLSKDNQAQRDCQDCIFQHASPYKNTPERTRLIFAIRDDVQSFIDKVVKEHGGTNDDVAIEELGNKSEDLSVQNMTKAILEIRKFFSERQGLEPEKFLKFLLTKVLLIYVSTEDLEDAFRLFTILNARGVPLRNSDILKSINLGALEKTQDKVKYARMWEEAEGELGDDFDRFLNHLRTILVKEKARLSLLQEFEDKIYEPKERDKATGEKKPVLLIKGLDSFKLVERYLGHNRIVLGGQNRDELGSYEFDNLVRVMLAGLPATDWIPPLLRYFDRFGYERLLEFLKLLDIKFSADWLCQLTPTDRIVAMNRVIQAIDDAPEANSIFDSKNFEIDGVTLRRVLDGPVYGKRFTRYVLLKLDLLYSNHDHRMQFETLSVEHILPQNPESSSQWSRDFTAEERAEWTDKIGNLVLISRRKNSSQGRLDYREKKFNYFLKCIDTCPNSIRVLEKYDSWTPIELKEHHEEALASILDHYGITD